MRYLTAAFICFILVFASSFAGADAVGGAPVGRILSVEGTVHITSSGPGPVVAQADSPVRLNDLVKTGAQSRAFILFEDDTRMTLSENTKLRIDKYVYDPENVSENKAGYSFLQGAFHYVSGLMAKKTDPDVTITTTHGSIGIRGTDIWGGTVDGDFGVYVTEGKVTVVNDGGAVDVNAGLGTSIKSREHAPSSAQAWGKERLAQIKASVALQQKELVEERIKKITQERREIQEKRRQEAIAELQGFIKEKQRQGKQEFEQTLRSKGQAIKQEIQAEAKQLVQQKLQEITALQQQGQQMKLQLSQTRIPAERQAIVQQMKQLGQHAKQRLQAIKGEAHAGIKQIAEQKLLKLKQEMTQYVEQAHLQAKQDIEQKIAQMKQDKTPEVTGEIQKMYERNQQELKSQLEQLYTEAQQQVTEVLKEVKDKQE